MRPDFKLLWLVVILGAGCLGWQPGLVAEPSAPVNGRSVTPVVAGAAQPFPLADVRLLPGPFYDAMVRDQKYLLFLEPDRLLRNFRTNVGLPVTAKPYG